MTRSSLRDALKDAHLIQVAAQTKTTIRVKGQYRPQGDTSGGKKLPLKLL
jgi:hypothetical protein